MSAARRMDLRRPDQLILDVRDLARSIAFYQGVLGLPVKLRGDLYAELQTDTVVLTLVERETADEAPRGMTLCWEVPDLGEADARLRAAGCAVETVTREPVSVFGRRLRVLDPDGHPLELACLTA